MRLILFILLFIPVFCSGQNYSLDIKLKEGDMLFYPASDMQTVNKIIHGFGNSFVEKIQAEKKEGNVFFPLMWIDLTDTSTFKYYSKNGKNYIYQIIDKGFGKFNIYQPDDSKRPLFDKHSGSIYFPEGTFLEVKTKFKGFEFSYKLDTFQPNSIYFFVFIPQYIEINKISKTVSL